MSLSSEWQDCEKYLPYKDYLGHWQFLPSITQRRLVKGRWEYRERNETVAEFWERQW